MLIRTVKEGNQSYMDEKRIFCIAPSEPVTIGRLEKDMEKLGDLYHLGRKDALAALEELKKYIEE